MTALTVYTAMFGAYDDLPPVVVESGARFIAFTDARGDVSGWDVIHIPLLEDDEPRMMARLFKALPHRVLRAADVWLWHDANVQLLVPPEQIVEAWLGDGDLAAPAHPSRDCAYDEALACVRKSKAPAEVLCAQTAAMEAVGYPHNAGLAETRVVIRRNTADIVLFNETWLAQIEQHSIRDQVSFNYAAWCAGVAWQRIDAWVPRHPWFTYREHVGR